VANRETVAAARRLRSAREQLNRTKIQLQIKDALRPIESAANKILIGAGYPTAIEDFTDEHFARLDPSRGAQSRSEYVALLPKSPFEPLVSVRRAFAMKLLIRDVREASNAGRWGEAIAKALRLGPLQDDLPSYYNHQRVIRPAAREIGGKRANANKATEAAELRNQIVTVARDIRKRMPSLTESAIARTICGQFGIGHRQTLRHMKNRIPPTKKD
jgi:hypothetical protein